MLDVLIDPSYLSKVPCDAPRYCCQNKVIPNGDQVCEGMCIPESWINDGDEDCDNGSDEKGRWKFEINNFLTLLGLGLIKIKIVLANFNNPRPSLIKTKNCGL